MKVACWVVKNSTVAALDNGLSYSISGEDDNRRFASQLSNYNGGSNKYERNISRTSLVALLQQTAEQVKEK